MSRKEYTIGIDGLVDGVMGNVANKKHFIALFIVFCIAIWLRFWQLGAVPAGFDADEAAYGYNAYSLLKTGTDEYGNFLPIALKSFGEYKPALYAYLTVPALVVFDVTPFAVRFPSALFGSLTVIALYLFAAKVLRDRKTALIAAGLLAISPWHINLSRTTSEVIVALFFILMMAFGMLQLGEEKKTSTRWLLITLVCGLLAILSYTAAIFFVVIVTLLFVGYATKKTTKKIVLPWKLLLLLGTFFICGLGYSMIGSINRFEQVNIFQHPATQLLLEEQIREDQFTKPLITRFFHNKMFNMVRTFLHNYNDYMTLDYLVLNGGYPFRERIPSTGLFYIWEIPILVLGLFALIKKSQKTGLLLGLWWLILLIPAAITFDEIPNVYRSLIVLPAVLMIIAVGVRQVMSAPKYLAFSVISILLLVGSMELLYYEHQYFVHQEVHQPWYRGYAYKELTTMIRDEYPSYKEFVITKAQSSPYIYFMFYNKIDPVAYQKQGSPRDLTYSGFDKYRFSQIDCPLSGGKTLRDDVVGKVGVLYVNKGTCPVPTHSVKVIKTINWQDNNPAFMVLEYLPQPHSP